MSGCRLLLLLVAGVLCSSCGLAENEQDEQNKYRYITFSDGAFAAYCLAHFDLNGDGRISYYEAQRVREISCPSLGIKNLYQIGDFTNIQQLNCSDNDLTTLDLRRCEGLQSLNCSQNDITSLDLSNLRSLTSVNCLSNNLPRLDVQTCAALSFLEAGGNDFTTLDVSSCNLRMELVDVLQSPKLVTLYCSSAQTIRVFRYESPTEIVYL